MNNLKDLAKRKFELEYNRKPNAEELSDAIAKIEKELEVMETTGCAINYPDNMT